jgi:RND family efflux transporter MFP subunit
LRRMWGWVAFLVVLVVVGLVVSRGHGKSAAATPTSGTAAFAGRGPGSATAVTVTPARAGELTATLSLTGTVNAVNSVQINPQTSGVVASLRADVGQQVRAGQVLATLDDSGVARSNVAQAQAQLAQAQLQLQQMENPAAFVSPTSLTQAQLAVQAAKAALQQQQDALTAAQQAVDVTAPGAGSVEVVDVTLGQAVTQGQPILQIVAPNSPVLVMAQVPQTALVSDGQSVSVWIPALQTVTGGTVTAVGTGTPAAASTTSSPSGAGSKGPTLVNPPTTAGFINVQVTLGNPPAGLRDGMTAQVNVTVPQAGAAPQIVQAAGTVQFAQDWTVTAPSSGSVATLGVNPGDSVTAGQLVATVTSPALQTAIDRAQAAVNQAQSQLQQAEASLQALQSPPSSPQASIDAQKQVVAEMQAALALREQQLAELTVVAPFDGTIQARNVSVGATVSPATSLFTLVGSGVNVQAPVPQQQAGEVKVGDPATIDPLDGGPVLSGRVQAVSPAASSQSLTFNAYVVPDQPSPRLLPGSAVNVVITTARVADAVAVPAGAVQTIDGKTQVYVVRNNVVALVPVQVGATGVLGTPGSGAGEAAMTQIVSGVAPGDLVVTSDTTYLAPGDRVIVSGGGAPAGAPGGGAGGGRGGAGATGSARRATGTASAGGR